MDAWHYDPAQDLNEPLMQRLRRFPREPDMLTYALRSAIAILFRASLRVCHRLRIVGAENLPAEGSFVLVANHSSHLDALCLLSAVPLRRLHQTFPAAAADYFFVNLPRVVLAVLFVNALPFDRQSHARESIALCRQLLATPGNILIIFPEGTRSADGQVGPFRPGISMLVAGTNVPVVPCFLSGARKAMPKGAWLPRPRPIRLTIGKPRSYTSASHDKESLRHICQDLREAVVELGGRGSGAKQRRR